MTKNILFLLIWICFDIHDSLAQVRQISKNEIIGKWTTNQTLNGTKVLLILKKSGRHKLIFTDDRHKKTKYYGSWTLNDSTTQTVFDSLTFQGIRIVKASEGLTYINLGTCDDCEGMWLHGTIYELLNDRMKLAIKSISINTLTFYRRHTIPFF